MIAELELKIKEKDSEKNIEDKTNKDWENSEKQKEETKTKPFYKLE